MLRSRDKDRYNWKTPYMTSAGGLVSRSLSSEFGFDRKTETAETCRDSHSIA
jgi:hypothetical protein